MPKIVRFPTSTSVKSSSGSPTSFTTPLALHIRRNLDRLQVLALQNPESANFMLELMDRFLTRHGV